MVNSVNLTDGLDGLASGVTLIVALFLAIAGTMYGFTTASVFCAAMAGACFGFLMFNRYPAKVFMGDTGSLALGGGIAAAAIMMNIELVIPIAGGVYVAEALSVIVQVVSYKTRKKRVLKMAPLHYHFELSGWKETKVVAVFWIVTFILCSISLLII
jgi:phospho-N-acetylmuramoyl-pentapeptide-transferase